MKRKKDSTKKKLKSKEISLPEPSKFKTTCYICHKTKSKDQMITIDASKGLYRCRSGRCVKILVQRALIRYGGTPTTKILDIRSEIPEKKKRGRPPKNTNLTGGHTVNGNQQESNQPVLSVTNEFNVIEGSQG